jgi:hypothetical protein
MTRSKFPLFLEEVAFFPGLEIFEPREGEELTLEGTLEDVDARRQSTGVHSGRERNGRRSMTFSTGDGRGCGRKKSKFLAIFVNCQSR